jgi:hypothetical protein
MRTLKRRKAAEATFRRENRRTAGAVPRRADYFFALQHWPAGAVQVPSALQQDFFCAGAGQVEPLLEQVELHAQPERPMTAAAATARR